MYNIHTFAQLMRFFLTVYILFFIFFYYKRCQILNTYQWGVSFRSLHLCLPLCADKIQISICALTTHTHTHSHTQHTHIHLHKCKLRVGKCFGVHAYCYSKPKQMFLPCCTNVYSSLQATKTYNMWKAATATAVGVRSAKRRDWGRREKKLKTVCIKWLKKVDYKRKKNSIQSSLTKRGIYKLVSKSWEKDREREGE